jgi:hypothetical protein
MFGRLGDLGRLSWGLLYWNSRKSFFRMRGASGQPPCQHPSDSGRAGETGCEALRGWRDPAAFRRMCPLLTTAPNGRRVCSVAAADVRPFWGRAIAAYSALAAFLALAAVLGVFVSYRLIGYKVSLSTVAWPPHWHRIEQARADYFYQMALDAYRKGDVRKSFLALNEVYALDPGNEAAGRLLADFTQIPNPEYSDLIYSRLIRGGGAGAEAAAQAWFRALLSRGDFKRMRQLSSAMLKAGGPEVPAWTQGLTFASEMAGENGDIDALLAGPAPVPAEARSILSLSRSIRTGSPGTKAATIEVFLIGATTSFEVYYALNKLIDLGRASEVIAFLNGQGAALLGSYERESLKLDAYSALGWVDLEKAEIGLILGPGPRTAPVTLVAAHLIRRPGRETAEDFFGILASKPLPETAENAGVHMALLCVAGVNGLPAEMGREGDVLSRIVAGPFSAWTRMRDFFQGTGAKADPSVFLPALAELPLEAVYAIVGRYHPAAAPDKPAGA